MAAVVNSVPSETSLFLQKENPTVSIHIFFLLFQHKSPNLPRKQSRGSGSVTSWLPHHVVGQASAPTALGEPC